MLGRFQFTELPPGEYLLTSSILDEIDDWGSEGAEEIREMSQFVCQGDRFRRCFDGRRRLVRRQSGTLGLVVPCRIDRLFCLRLGRRRIRGRGLQRTLPPWVRRGLHEDERLHVLRVKTHDLAEGLSCVRVASLVAKRPGQHDTDRDAVGVVADAVPRGRLGLAEPPIEPVRLGKRRDDAYAPLRGEHALKSGNRVLEGS